ncbi:acyltransferase [Pseudomonas sp. PDM14]|uniref:acyltransferase family protein n=1 Tax=Pseudomonas sp. PDM14 TaxID=2769288 RepID=UPI0017863028|nr:acyltransferase [Pseudomonas sp. PDM14]MBD9482598.1 acyltransferase [Pseudomonas sp. PDM14]
MKRFQVLDSFRGLFALAVVIYHSHALLSFTELTFFRNSFYFVEFFFVLSGFVLYHNYAGRLHDWEQVRHFAITRTARLYPLHVVMLAVFIGIECLKVLAEHYGMTFGSASFTGPRSTAEIAPNLLLLQSWWPGFNPLSFNYPAWSISIEYYLYMLFALIMVVVPGQSRPVFSAIALFAFIALYLRSDVLTEEALKGLGCFFAGVLTHALYSKIQHWRLSRPVATALEATVLGAIVLVLSLATTPQDILLSTLFCLAILVFAFESGACSALLVHRPFKWLGTLSYSIYMTHAALLFMTSAALIVAGKLTGMNLLIELPNPASGDASRYINTGSALLNNLLVVLQLIGVLIISSLTYRYIELPGIALGKRWSRRQTGIETKPSL